MAFIRYEIHKDIIFPVFYPYRLTHALTHILNLFKILLVPTHVCFDPLVANTNTFILNGSSRAHLKTITMSMHTQVIQQAYFPTKSHRKILHMT